MWEIMMAFCGCLVGTICVSFLMFNTPEGVMRFWRDGYNTAQKYYTNWDEGFKEGWNACRNKMLSNKLSNYNVVEKKDT